MEDNRRSSFKRPFTSNFENGVNKRGKFNDQFSETSHSSDTIYRILCPSKKIGSVIGKGGVIIKSLREETQAKITIDDSTPGVEERVIVIHSPSTKKPMKQNDTGLQCAAQDALLKLHDRIFEEDIGGINNGTNNNNEKLVIARLLVPNNMVGCLLGRKGDVIQRLRKETGANIRILPSNQLPICALENDELVQISAKPAIVKKALYGISTLLHQNPRKDNPNSGGPHVFRPPGPQMTNLPLPPDPSARWRGDYDSEHLRFRSLEFDHGGDTPTEFSMKILCHKSKIGGVIGKGGSNVRQIQEQFGTDIHVDDVAADSDERVICVSSFEVLLNPRSRTIDAILALQDKTSEHSEKGIVTSRVLLPSSKVGCIIGQGGHVINEMRKRTRADIRVYSKEEKPKCAGKDEELVQVSGVYDTAKDALAEVASRYRARCLRDSIPEPGPPFPPRPILPPVTRPSPHGARLAGYSPPIYPPSMRDHEPSRDYDELYTHPISTRDHDPYGPSPPFRDFSPYSHHQPLPRDYEPLGYRDPPRDYESNGYDAPCIGYPSPIRDFEYPTSRFVGGVDMKMPSSGRGSSAISNASEIPRTRPYGGSPESSIADIHYLNSSTHNTYQTYNGPKCPPHTHQESHTNINLYQNNPRQQRYHYQL